MNEITNWWNFILDIINDRESFRLWINEFGNLGFVVFMGIQVFQVVVFAVPGEVVQIAGGYLYGTFLGTLLSVAGITAGSLICFYISRIMGRRFVEKFVHKRKLENLDDLINKPSGIIPLAIMFFIPGFPKDLLSYAAGLTSIRFRYYFIITLLARFPGILISTYFGSNLAQQNYMTGGLIAVISVIAAGIAIVFRDRIIVSLRKIREDYHNLRLNNRKYK